MQQELQDLHLQLMQGVQHKMAIKIELCSFSDVEKLIYFIDNYWKKNHIFVRDRELFDWQHKGSSYYNFVITKDDDEIIGVLGFIPSSQYSSSLIKNNELWLAIWKVKDGVKKPGLGVMMLNYLRKKYSNPTICSLGLSSQVIPIYKALKYQVGVLSHRAFFNQNKSFFHIGIPDNKHLIPNKESNLNYMVLNSIDDIPHSFFSRYPKKNNEYIKNRYIRHPRYEYMFLPIYDNGILLSISIFRELNVDGVKIARIVDSFGENVMNLKFNSVFSKFVEDLDLEYVDLVSNMECELGSGFIQSSDLVTIPNYFEPFERKNVNVDFAYKSNMKLIIFRGDSDQDRPNI